MAMRLFRECVSILAEFPALSAWQTSVLRRLVASVLLLAACSKFLTARAGDELALSIALAVWELVLGGWLLSGKWRGWSLSIASFTFSAFVGALLVRLAVGSPTCDCFGAVRVSPHWTLVADVGVLVFLVWAIRSSALAVGVPTLIILLLLGCCTGMTIDSVRVAAIRSQQLAAESLGRRAVSLGMDGLAGADVEFIAEAMNAMSPSDAVAGRRSSRTSVSSVQSMLSSRAFRLLDAQDLVAPDEWAPDQWGQVSPVGILMKRDGRTWVVTGVVKDKEGAAIEVARSELESITVPLSEVGLGDSASLWGPAKIRNRDASLGWVGSHSLGFDRIWNNCGNIGDAAAVDVRFQMRNDSARPVAIERVEPSCGCLRFTALEGKLLQPGETSSLSVTVARGAGRSFSHSLRLELLGDSKETVRLRIFGRQDQGMIVTPSLVDFGVVEDRAGRENRAIRLTETSTDRFQVARVHLPELLQQQGDVEQTQATNGLRSYVIRLSVRTDHLLNGRNEGVVRIETTSRARPTVEIRCQAVGRSSRIQLPPVPLPPRSGDS